MKRSTQKKILSGVAGAAALLTGSGMVPQAEAVAEHQQAAVQVQTREEESYAEVADVKGEFSYQQDILTPPDEVFSLFGTAATAACAKPGFAFDKKDVQDYYVNIGGKIKKDYSVSLRQIKSMTPQNRNMMCSCATGTPVINTRVTGVALQDILKMAEIEEGVNTITMKDEEGYGLPMPLSYVLEKDALLVYQVGGADLPASQGAPLQVWMPGTVAKYFTRRVTDIELTAEEKVPEVEKADARYRAKVNVVNRFDGDFNVGDSIAFEGYADDCGTAITAVEFSMDSGKTWTSCPTKTANPDQWVYWSFDYVAERPGTYKLDVRARTEEGIVSPLASSVVFSVAGEKNI